MEYSRQRAVSDGTLQTLPISLRFFRREDLQVMLGSLVTEDWVWLGSLNTIQFPAPLANGVQVTVTRTTQIDKNIHEFALGAQFVASSVDDDFRQLLFLAQEYSENFGGGVDQAIEDSEEALAKAFEALAVANGINAKADAAVANSVAAAAVAAASKVESEAAVTQSNMAIDLYNAIFLPSYSAARALTNPPSGIYISGVTGSAPSRQAGHYTYDPSDTTSADNGGITLVIGTKRYKRVFFGAIFADWFGTKAGDASYDNYDAFNNARLAVMAQPRGGVLSATPGQYFIGTTLTFPNTDGKMVHLSLYGVVLSRMAGMATALVSAGSMTEVGGGSFRCDGLTCAGDYLAVVGASIVLSWVGSCEMQDVSCISGGTGIYLSNCFAFRGTNLRFQYCNGYGLRSETICHNMQLTNCAWNTCLQADVSILGQAFNLNFKGSDHEGGVTAYEFLAGGSAVSVQGEYIEGMSGLQFYAGAALRGFTMRDCWLGFNGGTQTWYNFTSGLLENNEFYNQLQVIDPSSKDFEVGVNQFDGTSTHIASNYADAPLLAGFTVTGGVFATPGYRRSRSSRIHLRGSANGAVDGNVFILPVGYRPQYPVRISTPTGRVLIGTDGLVTAYMGGAGYVDLSGVSFAGF